MRIRKYKYSRNDDYFLIPNLENSYWAGFIAADGCVINNQLKIKLSIKDKSHLEKFVENIRYSGPIKDIKTTCSNGAICSMTSLQLSSRNFVKDLNNNFNILPNKTYIGIPPNLENDLKLAYFIGYIDGDGCLGMHGNTKEQLYHTFKITAKSDKMRNWLKDIMTDLCEKTPCESGINLTIRGKFAKIGLEKLLKVDLKYKLNRKWDFLKGVA